MYNSIRREHVEITEYKNILSKILTDLSNISIMWERRKCQTTELAENLPYGLHVHHKTVCI